MKQILVVDDSPINLKLVRGALERLYRVIAVSSGKQALEFLRSHSVDLILLDINMPEMDGFDVAGKLREVGNKAPILIISAENDEDTVVRAKNLGVVDFVAKPFTPESILERVKKHV